MYQIAVSSIINSENFFNPHSSLRPPPPTINFPGFPIAYDTIYFSTLVFVFLNTIAVKNKDKGKINTFFCFSQRLCSDQDINRDVIFLDTMAQPILQQGFNATRHMQSFILSVKSALHIYFFSMEINIYTLNIKTTVTWHHDFYGSQGYKQK